MATVWLRSSRPGGFASKPNDMPSSGWMRMESRLGTGGVRRSPAKSGGGTSLNTTATSVLLRGRRLPVLR